MKMGIAHTGAKSAHGTAIKVVTGSKINHSLVYFEGLDFSWGLGESEDKPITRVYFESWWKKDKATGKTGMRGPRPWSEVVDWRDEKEGRKLICQELPHSHARVFETYKYCLERVKDIRYPHWQLLHNFMTNVVGTSGHRWGVSPKKWTCSEAAARVWAHIDPKAVLEFMRIGDIYFDHVTPGGKKYGLMEAVHIYMAWAEMFGGH